MSFLKGVNLLYFVVRRRDVNEAKRQWSESTSNKRMKLDNYFNRQFTDHISTQNATKVVENDGDSNGKWMWKVPTEASRLSMGLITVDPDDPMDNIYTGPQLMSLSEMTEFSREATLWGMSPRWFPSSKPPMTDWTRTVQPGMSSMQMKMRTLIHGLSRMQQRRRRMRRQHRKDLERLRLFSPTSRMP